MSAESASAETTSTGSSTRVNWRRRIILLGLGALTGLAFFTFYYAEGASYLSKDPKACANCHIMQPQYDSWQKSSHHTVATCVDCHLPTEFPQNYIAKTVNGWNHSKAFTLQNFPEPIRITEPNAEILQDNCERCHTEVTHGIISGPSQGSDTLRCTHCHRAVGHGPQAGLGGPLREEEIPEEIR